MQIKFWHNISKYRFAIRVYKPSREPHLCWDIPTQQVIIYHFTTTDLLFIVGPATINFRWG
jgi:hypothetical protein